MRGVGRCRRRTSVSSRWRAGASAAIRRRRIAQCAGDEHAVADARRTAQKRRFSATKPWMVTVIDSGPRVVSPPTSASLNSPASAANPSQNSSIQRAIGIRQCQRERRPCRRRAHRGEIGKVHRERFPADIRRRSVQSENVRRRRACRCSLRVDDWPAPPEPLRRRRCRPGHPRAWLHSAHARFRSARTPWDRRVAALTST